MNNATKSIPQILRDNICTIFNALNLVIAVALAAVSAWKNMLFIFIILINTAVGIVHEIKAKRQIERLTLLAQPVVTILRGDTEQTIRPEEIRKGDLLVMTAGCAVCTDCTVQEGWLEVNESILTGESEPVVKLPGDKLLSGSNVISGRCLAQAECGTNECFTAQMVNEVKKTRGSNSELLSSMKKVTKFTSILIVPLGVLLFVQAYFFRDTPINTAVVATSAGLLGMLPKGLVLLISIGLAVGVIRLSKKNVLVRDLHSLENLAHCDVVCLDKTGTLTEGNLEVEAVYPDMDVREFRRLMATYLVHTDDNNSTYQALYKHFSSTEPYEITAATPFSSNRKWSSVTLEDGRTLVLGAPEKLCSTIPQYVNDLMAQGKRILFVGLCSGRIDIDRIDIVAMIVISDKLRQNAVQTIRYFYEQGVDVKIISGDNPIQITLIDAVIEAFPAFFMSFEHNAHKVQGTFLGNALRSALPNSLAIFLGCTAVFFAAPHLSMSHAQMNLVMYLTVGIVSLVGVVKASLPMNLLHGFLSIASVLGFFCTVLLFAPLLQLPYLAISGAILLTLVDIPCILISILLKIPAPEESLCS